MLIAPEVMVVAIFLLTMVSSQFIGWGIVMTETVETTRGWVILGGVIGSLVGAVLGTWHYQWVQDPSFIHPWWWGGGILLVYGLVAGTHGLIQRHTAYMVSGILAFGLACLWR